MSAPPQQRLVTQNLTPHQGIPPQVPWAVAATHHKRQHTARTRQHSQQSSAAPRILCSAPLRDDKQPLSTLKKAVASLARYTRSRNPHRITQASSRPLRHSCRNTRRETATPVPHRTLPAAPSAGQRRMEQLQLVQSSDRHTSHLRRRLEVVQPTRDPYATTVTTVCRAGVFKASDRQSNIDVARVDRIRYVARMPRSRLRLPPQPMLWRPKVATHLHLLSHLSHSRVFRCDNRVISPLALHGACPCSARRRSWPSSLHVCAEGLRRAAGRRVGWRGACCECRRECTRVHVCRRLTLVVAGLVSS